MSIQPYQEADEEILRQNQFPQKALGTALGAAGAIGGLGPLLSRAAPFLSSFIPDNLAMKGLGKLDPRIKSFIDKGIKAGYSFDDIKNYLGEAIEGNQGKEGKAQDQKNIVKQYSPQLDQFIMAEIQNGRSPIEAGALAQMQEPFKRIIKKITEDHQAPFASILDTIYGSSQQAQPRPQGTAQTQGGQAGQGKANLAQTMQALTDAVRKMRGS